MTLCLGCNQEIEEYGKHGNKQCDLCKECCETDCGLITNDKKDYPFGWDGL